MKKKNENDLVEIFAGALMEAEIVKSLLNDSKIEVFLKDELMGTIAPWQTSPGGLGSVKIIISNADYDRAKEIVEEYRKNAN